VARELTPAELRDLLPVYALDALDADERAQVEAFLARTPGAAQEVAELQETAALLAFTGPDEVPEALWARIEGALGADPPRLVLPFAEPERARRRRGLGAKIAVGIAAASAVAAGVTAVVVNDEMSRQEDRLDRVAASVTHDGMRRAAAAAAADPRSRTARLVSSAGDASATVVAMPDGQGFLMGHAVPRLDAGQTYQLWAITGAPESTAMVPAGVLGRDLELAAFRVPEGARGFAITAEHVPGVPTTAGAPVLEGHFD
jgi:anti-sigma-K factor RskA